MSIFETSAVIITEVVEGRRPTDADGRSDDPAGWPSSAVCWAGAMRSPRRVAQ